MSEFGEKLIAAIRKRAENNPDYVYEPPREGGNMSCVYVYNGKPSCIVGCGLWDIEAIDADFEFKKTKDGADDTSVNIKMFGIIRHFFPRLDEGEMQWIYHVQNQQDAQFAWGKAVEMADNEMTKLANA